MPKLEHKSTEAAVNATIDALWIYPVKSMRGLQLDSCQVTPEGLAGDRQWMVIDENGQFISQRKLPAMALFSAAPTVTGVRLSHPEHGFIEVDRHECRNTVRASVWMTDMETRVAPKRVNQWLNDALASKHTLSLVTLNPTYRRPLDNQRFGDHTTYFADAAPILVANQESLEAFNRSLKFTKQLPEFSMARFRPNIVIAGIPAFSEHHFKKLSFKGGQLNLIDHCQRCSIITVNPQTGQAENTADTFSLLANLNGMPSKPKAPAFGVNSVVAHEHTSIVHTDMTITLTP